jgi:elongation factor P--(R)-beta-lysine ligase
LFDRTLNGRVLAVDGTRTVILDGLAQVVVESVTDVEPGDLVRVSLQGQRATQVERVFRPRRKPFSAGTETRRIVHESMGERLALRMRALDAIRAHLRAEGFLEVDTPAVAPCPGLDLHLDAYDVSDRAGALFGRLITSPEFHMKRLLVGGIPRCFQLARCWRAGELGGRHQPEFTMLEWYRAWQTLDAVLADTEAIVRAAASVTASPDAITLGTHRVPLDAPFERVTVREAFARHCPAVRDPIALARDDEALYYERFSVDVEPMLGRERPVFLTRFPACHASLARVCDDDATVCERAELYVAGVELCNAFLELTDPDEQRRRFEADQRARAARGLPVYPIDEDFMAALDEGMPPSAGNALGVDRLLALVMGSTEIATVMAFPRTPR